MSQKDYSESRMYVPFTGEEWLRIAIEKTIESVREQINAGFSRIPNAMSDYREAIENAEQENLDVSMYRKEILKVISRFKGRELILN
ncbi:MAG: hypothetical protein U9Q06_01485 [Nanoarchaeota archaeon]|nr:hypothetical protein [Nanoarchaeota archaeon]